MLFARFAPKIAREAYRWDARASWLFGLYSGMTIPFFAVIARRMGASSFELYLLVVAPAIGNLISIVVAWHMQHRPKRPYMLWLGLASRVLIVLMAFATERPLFVTLIVLSQLLAGLPGPAYAAMMRVAYPDTERGRMMGMVRIGLTVSAMIAGLSAGRLLEKGLPWYWVLLLAAGTSFMVAHELRRWRWRIPAVGAIMLIAYLVMPALANHISYVRLFPIAGILGIAALWMFNHLPDGKLDEDSTPHVPLLASLNTLKTDRQFYLYCLAFGIFGFGNWLRGPLVPILQVDELHITDEWVGRLAMITSGISAAAFYFWGRLMDRGSPFVTLTIAFFLQGFVALLFGVAHDITPLVLASIIQGAVGPGVELGALNAVMRFTDGENIPRYVAQHNMLVGIRGVIGPILGIWLLPYIGLRACFYLSAGVVWIGFVLMVWVVWCVLPREVGRGRMRRTRVPA